MSDAKKWQRGNLKLEGSNWLMIQIKKFYVLTFKSRHCNVYHKFMRYFLTVLFIVSVIGGFFALHIFVFFPE